MSFLDLKREVIDAGLCTACGACVACCPVGIVEMRGVEPEPVLVGNCVECGLCGLICPGKEVPRSSIEKMIFGRTRTSSEEGFGIYQETMIGWAVDSAIRTGGSSGGVATSLLAYGLENDIIDGAIVSRMSKERPWTIEPFVATTREEVLSAQKSKYLVCPSVSALKEIKERGFKRIGFVGMPCHIHALRKMAIYKETSDLARRIKFMIGLWCGTNFYFKGFECLITQIYGVCDSIEDITKLEFRGKEWPGYFVVETKDGRIFVGDKFSEYLRKAPNRCERDRCHLCWDFTAELADVSLGDVHGKKPYLSAIIVRTAKGMELIKSAENASYIHIKRDKEEAYDYLERQRRGSSFLRHKYLSLFRIEMRARHGWPVPVVS
jgi:coenzyme F420 hydrogenase subunit beta